MDDMMGMDNGMIDHDHDAMMPTGVDDNGSVMMDMNSHVGESSDAFCTGHMGMVMLMEGFAWALKGGHSCINLYFPGWTLNSAGKFWAAMVGVAALGIVTEGISKLRHVLSNKVKGNNLTRAQVKQISLMQTGLHGIHALTGYILMLATMTFALELLLSVILGLVIGYVIFGGDKYSHVTTNPCCAFLEDEAIERIPPPGNGSQVEDENDCCQSKEATDSAKSELGHEGNDKDELVLSA